jgi:surfeit locus 1 family protein
MLDAVPAALAPRYWAGHAVMVVLAVAATLLGVWQLDVWRGHRTDAATGRTHATPVTLEHALGPDQPFPSGDVGRPVTMAGGWLPADTVFVRGKEQGGHRGYWMVTPLTITATGSALPVVLGWVADPAAAPAAPTGSVALTAWLQPSEDDTGVVDDDETDVVVPELQTAELVQRVDQDLYDGYAVARGGVAGLPQADLPKLPDAGWSTALRNLLYAFQWWVFGGFAVLMWWRWLTEAIAVAEGTAAEEAELSAEDPASTVDT